ncbi:MAG: carbon-nitrogen hydrolase family protein [Pseudomonadota bacterium]
MKAESDRLRCLAFQLDADGISTAPRRDAHVDRVADAVQAAAERAGGVDLVLLPELSTVDYSAAAFDALADLAEPLDGPSLARFAALARAIDATVVFGMPRVDAHGRYFISQVVVDADGRRVGHYDKVHIAQFGASAEKRWFHRGDQGLAFEVRGWRLGVVICYDMRFPGYVSRLVQRHALDAVLHPVAFTRDGSWPSWHAFVQTRALEHQVYWLSLNRAGADWGHSLLCPPWVDETTQPVTFDTRASSEVIELARAALAEARTRYPFRQDALGDYSSVVP